MSRCRTARIDFQYHACHATTAGQSAQAVVSAKTSAQQDSITKNSKPKESVPMPSAEALQLMLDKMALHELVQNYCRAVDRRDYALLESLYHPDSIDDHSPMFKGSGPEFVRWVPSSVERFELTQHVIASASFVVDGTIAKANVSSLRIICARKSPAGDDRPWPLPRPL